jgi:hypothetical protein
VAIAQTEINRNAYYRTAKIITATNRCFLSLITRFFGLRNRAPSFANIDPVPSASDRTSDHPLGLTGRSGILPISLSTFSEKLVAKIEKVVF